MPRGNAPARRQNAPNRAPAPNAVAVFDEQKAAAKIVALVSNRRDQLAALLGVDPATPAGARALDRFVTVALDVVTTNRGLLEADPTSILSSIRTAAQLNLEPSGVLGDGVIIARRDRQAGGRKIARFEPMYRGLAKLARRSPLVDGLDWQIVYENDPFRLVLGSSPAVEHERFTDGDPGAIRGAYMVAHLTSGELVIEYQSTTQILKVRDQASRAWQEDGEASLWGKWPEPMMLKTVVKSGMKKLPLETVAQIALAIDNEQDAPRVTTPAPRQLTGLRAKLGLGNGESLSDGSGAEEGAEAGTGEAPDGKTAPEASTAGTEPKGADRLTGERVSMSEGTQEEADRRAAEAAPCGDPSPYVDADAGIACVKPKGHEPTKTHGGHKAEDGSTW